MKLLLIDLLAVVDVVCGCRREGLRSGREDYL
jgi:hypothetical protein